MRHQDFFVQVGFLNPRTVASIETLSLQHDFLPLRSCTALPVGCGYALPASTPQNLFAPCPFPVWVLSTHFSASASRPLPLLAPVVCMHCTCNAKLNYGARDPRGHGPFTIIIATIFWGTGKRRPTRTPTRYMLGSAGPSLPPYPPPRDCKGQLWRGVGR